MVISYILFITAAVIGIILCITVMIFLLLRSLKLIQDSITNTLNSNAENLNKRVERLTEYTDQRLKEISGQVERRLSEGFEKTTNIFTDVVKRLALIDAAQKKIAELSSNVVDLQTILADKRSRGAFGEVQLAALIRNLMPEKHFALQHTLSNGKRADCILFLPEPTGNVVIDAKFPLESYQRLSDIKLSEPERHVVEQQFRTDIRKHLQDIASKYIIPGETSDGAMMFIPAEAIFAEIHSHFPDLVENSHKLRVWMVSPTTMMAILTTARAVLKDIATRKQVHIIQEHLSLLSKDFDRFQARMDDLARHINQANADVEQVHKSSKKISSRFNKIEAVELQKNNELDTDIL
jgi:DNA recombination protein RmuC